ncbi:MAG: hypothetical protein U0992_06725 [Planctomycetaceae bacterium]
MRSGLFVVRFAAGFVAGIGIGGLFTQILPGGSLLRLGFVQLLLGFGRLFLLSLFSLLLGDFLRDRDIDLRRDGRVAGFGPQRGHVVDGFQPERQDVAGIEVRELTEVDLTLSLQFRAGRWSVVQAARLAGQRRVALLEVHPDRLQHEIRIARDERDRQHDVSRDFDVAGRVQQLDFRRKVAADVQAVDLRDRIMLALRGDQIDAVEPRGAPVAVEFQCPRPFDVCLIDELELAFDPPDCSVFGIVQPRRCARVDRHIRDGTRRDLCPSPGIDPLTARLRGIERHVRRIRISDGFDRGEGSLPDADVIRLAGSVSGRDAVLEILQQAALNSVR